MFRARKVSFAGSGWRELHDECVQRQEWIIAVIDTKVLHHYFDNLPYLREDSFPNDAIMMMFLCLAVG